MKCALVKPSACMKFLVVCEKIFLYCSKQLEGMDFREIMIFEAIEKNC